LVDFIRIWKWPHISPFAASFQKSMPLISPPKS
jgi:hypothetical protein